MSHAKNNGFTLIELMLSMTFVSLLLFAIAITTIQISKMYNKGITLREVNQVGRSITEDLQRSIGASAPFDIDTNSPTAKYVVRPGGGRLCIGSHTYAWNYGSAIVGGQGAPAIFNTYDDGEFVRFVKVADASASLCTDPTLSIQRANAAELLAAGDRDLALHAFSITSNAEDPTTGQVLYAISFTVGTNDHAQLTTNDASCRPPSEGAGNEDYCSVNQFDIIARAGNNTGGE